MEPAPAQPGASAQPGAPTQPAAGEPPAPPKWKPLSARQRRVLGVLVEKAKTTPDAYPMTLNAVTTGCNQKTNRNPISNYDAEQIEETLGALRQLGAVVEIIGGGRTAKYKHLAYEWFGVNKFELAILTELLLRGEQSVGDLRSRASRMEPIPDQTALKPLLHSLVAKGLVKPLTPEGRGQMVTHGVYPEAEWKSLEERYRDHAPAPADGEDDEAAGSTSAGAAPSASSASASSPSVAPRGAASGELAELRQEVRVMRAEIAELRARVALLEDDGDKDSP